MFFRIPERGKDLIQFIRTSLIFITPPPPSLAALTLPLLWLVVADAVVLVRGRCLPGTSRRLLVPLLLAVPLSFASVVEFIFLVQLHVHLGLHPQSLRPTEVFAVTGCGGFGRPIRLHVIGHRLHCGKHIKRKLNGLEVNGRSDPKRQEPFRTVCVPLGVLWTGCLSLFHLGFTSTSSSSLSDEWEEAYEELCSSTDSSLSESESSGNQKTKSV